MVSSTKEGWNAFLEALARNLAMLVIIAREIVYMRSYILPVYQVEIIVAEVGTI
jgi:hypothetical protein